MSEGYIHIYRECPQAQLGALGGRIRGPFGQRPAKRLLPQGENTMTNMSGADAIVATLKAYDVEVAFGFIGHSTHQIAQAMSESGIPTVNPATELGGAYMAVAYNYLRNAPAAVHRSHLMQPALAALRNQDRNAA